MRVKDLINNLDKSEANECHNIRYDMELIVAECNLGDFTVVQGDNVRLRSFWMANHYCTDTYVGYRAYFLDDKFVFLGYQPARKSEEVVEWLNEESIILVRDYLLSLSEEEELDLPNKYLDLEEEIGEGYPIEYTGQALRKEVLYKGKLVDIIKDDGRGYTNFHTITIKEKDTSREVDIDVRNILVPWYVNKENKL